MTNKIQQNQNSTIRKSEVHNSKIKSPYNSTIECGQFGEEWKAIWWWRLFANSIRGCLNWVRRSIGGFWSWWGHGAGSGVGEGCMVSWIGLTAMRWLGDSKLQLLVSEGTNFFFFFGCGKWWIIAVVYGLVGDRRECKEERGGAVGDLGCTVGWDAQRGVLYVLGDGCVMYVRSRNWRHGQGVVTANRQGRK